MTNLSLYLHVPFCTVKCSYCAFNVYVNQDHLIEPFVSAVCQEIRTVGETNPGHAVHTIYFGGGTPTLLKPHQYSQILNTVREQFTVLADSEITTEANPDDLTDISYLQALHQLGIHRLSIGVQSTHQSQLELFGRLHNAETVSQAVKNARTAGFRNLSLDLIYGIPQQTMTMWDETLRHTLELEVEHISLYALGIEPQTAMEYWIRNNKLSAPDDELAADMYDHASDVLDQYGYVQYEIANWAKLGFESEHNKQYWRNLPYLGLGPGAHGYAGNIRYIVERSPTRYIKALANESTPRSFPLTSAVTEYTAVTREDEIEETIMMGLRLLQEGIAFTDFEDRFGLDLRAMRGDVIQQYQKLGMLEQDHTRLRLTAAGRFVSNRILRDLV
jgi:oxygen-independent coproporphyrinogen III oxidase